MRLTVNWIIKTLCGMVLGAVACLALMLVIVGLISYATNAGHLMAMNIACVLAIVVGGILGGVRGGRYCMRTTTRERIEGIIRQYFPNDYAITRRAGRSWFHWCCQRPMFKFIAGETNNTERVCLHCGRYETYDIVRFDPFYGNDTWGWRLVS